ncbi:MAG: hypothetical protein J7577_15455 [Sphingobacteriaceae bacterium]|nr:hypothetical protein [Sphingobacteriaceae bacterium]
MDTIVKAVCEISVDIGKQLQDLLDINDKEGGFDISDLFTEEFLLEMSIRREEILDRVDSDGNSIEGIGPSGLISKIASYFNSAIFLFPEFNPLLEGSEILIMSKEESKLICIGDKPKDRLQSAIKKLKILKILISNLKHEKIKMSLEKLEIFETELFYKGVVTTNKLEGQPIIPVIDVEFLDHQTFQPTIVDRELYWINIAKLKNFNPAFSDSEELKMLIDSDGDLQIGLLVGNHILPYPDIDLSKYILPDKLSDYYFLLFENTYSKGKTIPLAKSELVQKFINSAKDDELNKLLSYLKNNFYIEGIEIPEKFSEFFNTVVTLDNLDHIEDFQFLLSSNYTEETALGVYTSRKNDTSYNLLHWVNHHGEKTIQHYRKEIPETKAKKQVSTLKPAICYYFLEKYFEDILENILKDKGYKYISNLVLYENKSKNVEIDAFVQVENKFYYIEAKTKLTKFYIEEFLKRSSEMIKKFDPMLLQKIEIEFILLGSFSDSTVKDYQYFINESPFKKDGYNIPRNGINCIPYHFSVPIPDLEGRKITCIAEPEFEKLQNLVLQICPK